MKKHLVLLISLLLCLSLCGCGLLGLTRGGDVDTAGRTIQSCGGYSEGEIAAAMDVVTNYFAGGFAGCTLLDIRYDGDASAAAEREWAEQYDAPRAMVLRSDFYSGQGNPSLNQDYTYRNWSWVLTWEGRWVVKTCGYG